MFEKVVVSKGVFKPEDPALIKDFLVENGVDAVSFDDAIQVKVTSKLENHRQQCHLGNFVTNIALSCGCK